MKDTSEMTVPELKAEAKIAGIKGFSKLKKTELLKAVNAAHGDLMEVVDEIAASNETASQMSAEQALDLDIYPIEPVSNQLAAVVTAAASMMDASLGSPELIDKLYDDYNKECNKAKALRRRIRKQGGQAGF